MSTFRSPDLAAGRPVVLASGIRRLVAPNGGLMTGPGTNTYLLGQQDIVILDPGPAMAAHLEAILEAVQGQRVAAIVVTHTHIDHSPAAAILAQTLGVPVWGRLADYPEYQDPDFRPDHTVQEADCLMTDVGALTAVLTPGHASNHVCWWLNESRVLFTGDHILGGVSPVIVHPDGSLVAYLASLDRVAALAPDVLLPGHGPAVLDPLPTIERLAAHRRLREDRVVAALSATQACAVEALIPTIYADVSPALYPMARHTLLSHLVKLESEQRVRQTEPDLWQLV